MLSAGVALVSYRYLAKVGSVPPTVAGNRFLDPWIIIHAGGAATALLLGPLQFLPAMRRYAPIAHRWTGRVYVVGCLVGGVSALVLAAGISSGPIAGAGFATLGVLWIGATATGWVKARTRHFADHRHWMIRSFALTFSAVTLRIYVPLAMVLHLDPLAAYRAIAWACWMPNLLAAECYIRWRGTSHPAAVRP